MTLYRVSESYRDAGLMCTPGVWGLAVSIVNIVVAGGRSRNTYNDPFTKGV